MALSYNLKYQKQNFFYKVLLQKEGEIIIDRHSFRLKGKGAQDIGETIYFSDIKDFLVSDDQIKFTTFSKERYVLSNFLNLFDDFLKDFFRVQNEYLAENLFMKSGMLYKEYEGNVEVLNRFGKNINKGMSRIQLYEGSIVIIPEKSDCFVIFLNFLKNSDFDEDDYNLKLTLDTGSLVTISKLGTNFSELQETLESLLGKMYERVINNLKEVLPDFDAQTLLKLAYYIKDGKCVKLSLLKKIHEDLPKKVEEVVFSNINPAMKDKIAMLRSMSNDDEFHIGFSFYTKADSRDIQVKSWFLLALPEHNIIATGTISDPKNCFIYFFRIIMERGDSREKLADKILELNQTMFLFKNDFSPLYKDKRELRKTKYKMALRKLAFLRLIRKSYLGKSFSTDINTFKQEMEKLLRFAPVKSVINTPVSLLK